MNKTVRLMCYIQDHNEIIVEGFDAKDWGDFVIIAVDPAEFSNHETSESLSRLFSQHYADSDKQVILIPSNMDISFYGVVEVADEAPDSGSVSEQTD